MIIQEKKKKSQNMNVMQSNPWENKNKYLN